MTSEEYVNLDSEQVKEMLESGELSLEEHYYHCEHSLPWSE